MYTTDVLDRAENEFPKSEDYHVLQEFSDVFLNEVLGLTPKKDIDFTIDLVLGTIPVSKRPYGIQNF